MLRSRLPFLCLCICGGALALIHGGCGGVMTPTVAMEVTVLGHEKYEVNFGNKGIVRTEDSKLRIDVAGLVLDPATQKICSAAQIYFKSDAIPKTILMEDITDEQPVRLIYEDAPKVTGAHIWKQTSSYKDLTDDRFAWLKVIDNSVRVYRFTLTMADGEILTYRQATMYPSYVKEGIRKGMGSSY